MKEYFLLQYKRNNRKLKDFGIEPIIGYLLLLVLFIVISLHLFEKYEFAPYLYLIVSLGVTSTLSEEKRNDFLRTCFSKMNYPIIRIIENMASSLPFIAILFYKGFFLPAIILTGGAALLVRLSFKGNYSIRIPTPFYKKPFEFTVGFRKTFLVFPIAYGLSAIAISVNNFNLGIAALLLVFLTTITYHLKPENEFYVWSYNLTPELFLKEKLKTAITFTLLLALPVLIALGLYFVQNLDMLLVVLLVALGYLVAVILGKYSVYPREMNLPQGFVILLCIFFPPFLLAIIPYFFIQSKKKLSPLLYDTNN